MLNLRKEKYRQSSYQSGAAVGGRGRGAGESAYHVFEIASHESNESNYKRLQWKAPNR